MPGVNKKCIEAAFKASGGKISQEELRRMFSLANEIKKTLPRKKTRGQQAAKRLKSAERKLTKKAEELGIDEVNFMQELIRIADEESFEQLLERRQAVINLQAKKNILSQLKEGDTKINNNKKFRKIINDAYFRAKSLVSNTLSDFEASVNNMEGLDGIGMKLLQDGGLDNDIVKARHVLNGGEGDLKALPKEAVKLAKVINHWELKQNDMLNRNGAHIKFLKGYMGKQKYDAYKISMNEEQFIEDAFESMDFERMGIPDEGVKDYINELVKRLRSGNHEDVRDVFDDAAKYFKGSKNIGRSQSHARKIHFKTPDDYIHFKNTYGSNKRIIDDIFTQAEINARNVSLMQTFGVNAQNVFDQMQKFIEDTDKSGKQKIGKVIKDKLKGTKRRVRIRDLTYDWLVTPENMFKELTGETQSITKAYEFAPTVASFASDMRALQVSSKLGMSLLPSLSDYGTGAAALQGIGVNVADSYLKLASKLGQGLSDTSLVSRNMNHLGVASDSMIANLSRFTTDEVDLNGIMGNMAKLTFKFNGMNKWNKAIRGATVDVVSEHLASMAGKSFDNLHPSVRQSFVNANITSDLWDIMRSRVVKVGDDKATLQKRIFADTYDDIDDEAIRKYIKSKGMNDNSFNRSRAIEMISSDVGAYFNKVAMAAVPEPDLYTKALIHRGTYRGTLEGEMLRFMGQFKGFPLSMARVFSGTMNTQGKYFIAANLIASTTVLGYLGMTAKDAIRGNTPKDPTKWQTWMEAMTKGGGLGIYADILLHDYNRYNQGLFDTLAGPAPAQFSRLLNLTSSIVKSVSKGDLDAGKTANKVGDLVGDNLPFSNIIIGRQVFDYLIGNQISEILDEDSLDRTKKYLEETGQTRIYPLNYWE